MLNRHESLRDVGVPEEALDAVYRWIEDNVKIGEPVSATKIIEVIKESKMSEKKRPTVSPGAYLTPSWEKYDTVEEAVKAGDGYGKDFDIIVVPEEEKRQERNAKHRGEVSVAVDTIMSHDGTFEEVIQRLEKEKERFHRAIIEREGDDIIAKELSKLIKRNSHCRTCGWCMKEDITIWQQITDDHKKGFVKVGDYGSLEKVTNTVSRCRKNAPTMSGYPVVFEDDWCGEHKFDEGKV